ncbi:MAG: hypothetical protein ACK5PQ_02780 [Alphaproteobacteria bacterium]
MKYSSKFNNNLDEGINMYKQLLLWTSIISSLHAASCEYKEPLKKPSTTVTKAIEHLTNYVNKYKDVRKSGKYIPVLWVLDARGIKQSQETERLVFSLKEAFQPGEAVIQLVSWCANPFQNEKSIERENIFWNRIIRGSTIDQIHQSLKDAHIQTSVKFHLILTNESPRLSEELAGFVSEFGIILSKKKPEITASSKENNGKFYTPTSSTVQPFSNTASPEKSPERRASLKNIF